MLVRQVFPPKHTKQKNKKRPSDSTSPILVAADAGSDWVTWSGEPVVPDASAVNNNPDDGPLTIQGTADAVEGITVAFDPNGPVEDPTAEA